MEWIKSRMINTFKHNVISGALALLLSVGLLKVDPTNSPKQEIGVFTQPERDLFEYVTRADEFHEVSEVLYKLLRS